MYANDILNTCRFIDNQLVKNVVKQFEYISLQTAQAVYWEVLNARQVQIGMQYYNEIVCFINRTEVKKFKKYTKELDQKE